LIREVALGLASAHALGVIHRDLKPANIVMAGQRPLLTDFGLARDLDASLHGSRLSTSGRFMGTPGYWPPEQAEGRIRDIGFGSDVYGLGATLYGLLAGQAPYVGASLLELLSHMAVRPPLLLRKLRRDVPERLESICMRCLSRDPEDRYPSVAALAEDLQAFLEDARQTPPPRRGLGLALALGVGSALVLCLVAFALLARRGEIPRAALPPADPPGPVEPPEPPGPAGPAPAKPEEDPPSASESAIELVRAGRTALHEGHADEARELADRALALDPNLADAYSLSAMIHDSRRSFADAIVDLERCLQLGPRNAQAIKKRWAVILCERFPRRSSEAIPVLEALLRDDPKDNVLWDNLGRARFSQRRWTEALDCFDRSLELDPSKSIPWNQRGNTLTQLHRPEEALESFTKSLKRDPSFLHAYRNRGNVLLGLGRPREAVADFSRVIELRPNEARGYAERALAHERASELRAAHTDLVRALELLPPGDRRRPALEQHRDRLAEAARR
jgi:tetratricopeptide (TPR) repeat protein